MVATSRRLATADLLAVLEPAQVEGELPPEVSGIAYDSRRVRAGDWFFALPGLRADGASFARAARDAGATAVVAEHSTTVRPEIRVANARQSLARAAVRFYDSPAAALCTVGVTGTNGKTTVSWLVRSILEAAGWSVGLIGTLGAVLGGEREEIAFTTPESPELNALLRRMVDHKQRAAVLEVSSHGLELSRSFGIAFDVTVFTNLTQDHLDFHDTAESYLDAKLRLFDGRNGGAGSKPTIAVINAGDPHGESLLAAARIGGQRPSTFAVEGEADFVARQIARDAAGSRFVIEDAEGSHGVRIRLPGQHNVENAVAAWAVAASLNVDAADRLTGLAALAGVPGRLEIVDAGQSFTVYVDYAHTPDGLDHALRAIRPLADGKLHCLIGAGGDRDPGKRAEMGRIAAQHSDRVIFTSDNPRDEDPQKILDALVSGVPGDSGAEIEVVVDRRAAIRLLLSQVSTGDIVLIAGKGHEVTQTIGSRVLPFDDREQARAVLSQLVAGTETS